jgi:hypothetical protein
MCMYVCMDICLILLSEQIFRNENLSMLLRGGGEGGSCKSDDIVSLACMYVCRYVYMQVHTSIRSLPVGSGHNYLFHLRARFGVNI